MNQEQVNQLLDPAYACRLLDAFDDSHVAIRSHDGVDLVDLLADEWLRRLIIRIDGVRLLDKP